MTNRHLRYPLNTSGFTLVELLIVIAIVGFVWLAFSMFTNNYLLLYTQYEQDGLNFTELANQSQRVASVLRGLTDIVSESSNSLTVYAYFSPRDAYVSEVSYYLNTSGTELLATVTPMTANPPIGTLETSEATTYTIISHYYQAPGVSLFQYYTAGTLLTLPISDEHSITAIQVNLAEPTAEKSPNGQSLATMVSLRNRASVL